MVRVVYLTLIGQLILASEAFAQAQGSSAPQPGFGEVFSRMLLMFVIVFLIFYFMIMKPQQQKLKAQNEMLAGLRAGDSIVTSGGILGKISKVEQDFVLIEIANNVKIKVEPSHISKKVEKSGQEKAQ